MRSRSRSSGRAAPRPIPGWRRVSPASNGEGLKDIQKFDVALAKQLLAEAGSRTAKASRSRNSGLRATSPLNQSVAGALGAMLKHRTSGSTGRESSETQVHWQPELPSRPKFPFGFVSYGMDFLDPFNMLSVWLSGGRHSWSNAGVRTKVKEAAAFLGAIRAADQDVPGRRERSSSPTAPPSSSTTASRSRCTSLDQGRGAGAGQARQQQPPLRQPGLLPALRH